MSHSNREQRYCFYQNQKICLFLTGSEAWRALYANSQLIGERRSRPSAVLQSLQLGVDASGSVLSIVSGYSLATLAYTAYGYTFDRREINGCLRFTGELPDASMSCYLLGNYRMYNVSLMRFLTPDAWSPFAAGGLNTYAYCESDPVNNVDPSGHGKNTVFNLTIRPSSPTNNTLRQVAKKVKYIWKTSANLKALGRIDANKELVTQLQQAKLANKLDLVDLVRASSINIARAFGFPLNKSIDVSTHYAEGKRALWLANKLREGRDATIVEYTGTPKDKWPVDIGSDIRQPPAATRADGI